MSLALRWKSELKMRKLIWRLSLRKYSWKSQSWKDREYLQPKFNKRKRSSAIQLKQSSRMKVQTMKTSKIFLFPKVCKWGYLMQLHTRSVSLTGFCTRSYRSLKIDKVKVICWFLILALVIQLKRTLTTSSDILILIVNLRLVK